MESHVVEGVGVVDEMELWVIVRRVEFRLYFLCICSEPCWVWCLSIFVDLNLRVFNCTMKFVKYMDAVFNSIMLLEFLSCVDKVFVILPKIVLLT